MQVLPYHRLVKDLGGQSPSAFLAALAGRVQVSPGSERPGGPGEVAMYLDGRWYTLRLAAATAGTPPAETLDVARLQAQVLGAAARHRRSADGQADRLRRRHPRPGGARRRVSTRGPRSAFAMHPVSVADLMAIADAGGIMPPKSTWFEPKLRDGLLSHLI